MDYKEKYEQGLECIQEILSSGQEKIKMTLLKERLQPFFPELKESEDELTWLTNFIEEEAHSLSMDIRDNEDRIKLKNLQRSLAWLEKQKAMDKEIVFRPLLGTDIRVAAKQALEKLEIGKKVVLAFNGAYIPVNDKTVSKICDEYDAWIEKQGNVDKTSYEIAEKEKYDFVSGKFIECRKSFDEFKEDNSYWFEYVGNDTYIGRSDNILNKSFHITPRQLYCLFTQEHRPKENNVDEETNGPTSYGKYVDECLNDAAKHFFSEGEDNYSVADLFYAGVKCGKSWLEKQGRHKPVDKIQLGKKYKCIASPRYSTFRRGNIYKPVDNFLCSLMNFCSDCFEPIEDDEQKPVDNLEPKFHKGDWVISKINHNVYHVLNIEDNKYQVETLGCIFWYDEKYFDGLCRLWTIQDAKDGDVLAEDSCIFIIQKLSDNGTSAKTYCSLYNDGDFEEGATLYFDIDSTKPASKEQRDTLFKKMKKAGYQWDAEKKELKLLISNGGDF